MYCVACGSSLERDARFCTRCGRTAYVATPDPSRPDANAPSAVAQKSAPSRETVIRANVREYRPDGLGMGSSRVATASDRYADADTVRRGRVTAVTVIAVTLGLVIWAGDLSASRLRGPAQAAATPAPRVVPTPVSDQARQEIGRAHV